MVRLMLLLVIHWMTSTCIGRTRLSQARAELGMTDRTGGPSSSNYPHRQRPEKYDEDDEADSDGEDITILKTRSGQPIADNEEERKRNQQDTTLALSLRSRAISVEKVINSMLEQPPPLHPTEEHFMTPPSSPKMAPANMDTGHPHHLPNGVRLRLVLGTIINDFFARQAPQPPLRHRQSSSTSSTPESSSSVAPPTVPCLPQTLKALAPISFYSTNASVSASSPSFASQTSDTIVFRFQRKTPLKPSTRVLEFYNAGADRDTANSPPELRCPRHLHTGQSNL
jgi:hypothetical protein